MSERSLTQFEARVLRRLNIGTTISGNKMVAWVAAARRMEKRGLLREVSFSPRWVLTQAGHTALLKWTEASAGEEE